MIVYNFDTYKCFLSSDNLKLTTLDDSNKLKIVISQSLYNYLTNSKKKIDNNVVDWDYYKKLTNPYEFIHTPPNNSNKAVAEYSAISRSFYKMIEICVHFNLFKEYETIPINSFHLAEGPGGFIEAMIYMRKNKNDKYHGMTLQNDNKNIPKWNKLKNKFKFINNIHYENGPSGNGDLLNVENFTHCFNKYKNSMNIITGDGGFDFSIDYEKQEISSTKLVLAQIFYALMMQSKNGHFILKIFDVFYYPTIELLYLLNIFYTEVSICKPKTSRFANSEKYLVCKFFRFTDTSNYFPAFLKILSDIQNPCYIKSIFNFNIPLSFINSIEELNCIYGKKQLNMIHNTLMMIQERRNDKIERLRKSNIEKCIQWCSKNNVPCNNFFKPQNIFTKHINSNTKENIITLKNNHSYYK